MNLALLKAVTLTSVATLISLPTVAACGGGPATSDHTTAVSRPPALTTVRAAPRAPRKQVPEQAPKQATKSEQRGSPFDLDDPQIANLDPDLRAAVQHAARDAWAAGVEFRVTSGWRSWAHQQRLLDQAIIKYGSRAEALRFVSTPGRSYHVKGKAVDIGPAEADAWLSRHGADYGLCQMYANEIWHFELATQPGGTCPPQYADSSAR